MQLIEGYLSKATEGDGFQSFLPTETQELQHLSLLAEAWEDRIPLMPIEQPKTLLDMIEFKMYQMKLKQKDLAQLLGIAPSRLSEVLNGKRKINLELAKRLHTRLKIEADFILKNV